MIKSKFYYNFISFFAKKKKFNFYWINAIPFFNYSVTDVNTGNNGIMFNRLIFDSIWINYIFFWIIFFFFFFSYIGYFYFGIHRFFYTKNLFIFNKISFTKKESYNKKQLIIYNIYDFFNDFNNNTSTFNNKTENAYSDKSKSEYSFVICNLIFFIFIFFSLFFFIFKFSLHFFIIGVENSSFIGTSDLNRYSSLYYPSIYAKLGGFFVVTPITIFVIFISFVSFFFNIVFTNIFNYKDKTFYININDFYFYNLAFLAICSLAYVAFSNNFLAIYVGLELFGIIIYILIATYSDNRNIITSKYAELSIKYLIASFLGSLFFLVGVSFIYLSFGDFSISKFYYFFIAAPYEFAPLGLAPKLSILLVISGLSVKMGLAPYHTWVCGVYDNFDNKLFQFIIIYPKFFILLTIFNITSTNYVSLYSIFDTNISFFKFSNFFFIVGFASIIVGSISASVQYNIKRFMMFSSIANSGYIMISMGAGFSYNYSSIIYIITYFFSINFFFIIFNTLYPRSAYSSSTTWNIKNFSSIRSTQDKFMLTVAFLNFSGIPPFATFFSKLAVVVDLFAAEQFGYVWVLLIFSVVSAYYSIRPIFYIWFVNQQQAHTSIIFNKYKPAISKFNENYSNIEKNTNFSLLSYSTIKIFYDYSVVFVKRLLTAASLFSGPIIGFFYVSIIHIKLINNTNITYVYNIAPRIHLPAVYTSGSTVGDPELRFSSGVFKDPSITINTTQVNYNNIMELIENADMHKIVVELAASLYKTYPHYFYGPKVLELEKMAIFDRELYWLAFNTSQTGFFTFSLFILIFFFFIFLMYEKTTFFYKENVIKKNMTWEVVTTKFEIEFRQNFNIFVLNIINIFFQLVRPSTLIFMIVRIFYYVYNTVLKSKNYNNKNYCKNGDDCVSISEKKILSYRTNDFNNFKKTFFSYFLWTFDLLCFITIATWNDNVIINSPDAPMGENPHSPPRGLWLIWTIFKETNFNFIDIINSCTACFWYIFNLSVDAFSMVVLNSMRVFPDIFMFCVFITIIYFIFTIIIEKISFFIPKFISIRISFIFYFIFEVVFRIKYFISTDQILFFFFKKYNKNLIFIT